MPATVAKWGINMNLYIILIVVALVGGYFAFCFTYLLNQFITKRNANKFLIYIPAVIYLLIAYKCYSTMYAESLVGILSLFGGIVFVICFLTALLSAIILQFKNNNKKSNKSDR